MNKDNITGFRCHDADACAMGQIPCPTPFICGCAAPECSVKEGTHKPAEAVHQIQEPSTEVKLKGSVSNATFNDERAAFESNELSNGHVVCLNGIGGRYTDKGQQDRWEGWQARAALADTPAHHAPDAKRLIDEAKAHASKASRLTRVLLNEPTGTIADTDIAIWIEHAQQLLNTIAATQAQDVNWDAELGLTAMHFVDRAGDVHPGIDDAETICADFYAAMISVIDRMPHVQRMKTDAAMRESAAAPVLPEPCGVIVKNNVGAGATYHHGVKVKSEIESMFNNALGGGAYKAEFVYTEQQVRALLATGGQAQAVEQAPVLYVSKGQLDNHRDPDGPDSANAGRYLPARITPAGNFTMPLFAAPQAQAEHIKALIEVSRMPNQEHVADAHNAAVRHLRAIAAAKEQE